MKTKRLGSIAFLGLLVSALGIVTPILWDHFRSTTALELRQVSNSIVVGRTQVIDKLQFAYDGKSVSGLSRIELVIANTGRTPIREADIVTPVMIRLRDAAILDARINKVVPGNVEASCDVGPSLDAVTMRFPLLNPGDAVYLTLLAATDRAYVTGSARIAGLSDLVLDLSAVETVGARRERNWAFYVVAGMSALATLFYLVAIHMHGVETAIARLSQRRAFQLPADATAADSIAWISKTFAGDKTAELKPVMNWLTALPSDGKLTPEQERELRAKLRGALADVASMRAALVLFAVLSLGGVAYILHRLW